MPNGIFNLKQQLQGLIQKAWTGSQTTPAVEYLVVAGGGGGGLGQGSPTDSGGGGAGGLLQGIVPVATGSSITVTVGAGGAVVNNGNNSVFSTVTTIGGGAAKGSGTGGTINGNSGGSGGGGSAYTGGAIGTAGQGTFGQGNLGGVSSSSGGGGGGGGAGTIGLTAPSTSGANGGAGIASAISGTLTAYAGGGGGQQSGIGGVGGGGNGAASNGTAGTVNTGGGGGAGNQGSSTGTGGSGIVIISYPDTYNAPSALTGTYTASTSGSGSVYSSGSAYLLIADNSVLSVGAGNFTIEIWLNPTSLPTSGNYKVIWSKRTSGSTTGGATLAIDSSGNYLFFVGNGTGTWGISGTSSGQTASLGSWQHLAMVRNGNNLILYKNGVAGTTVTLNFTVVDADQMSIMAGSAAGGQVTDGYFSNFRLVKGTAVYTSNFTPSTTPLTAITNTSLLLNTVSGAPFTDSSGNNLTVSTVSSPTWNQLSPFATGLGYKNRVYTWTGSGTVTF